MLTSVVTSAWVLTLTLNVLGLNAPPYQTAVGQDVAQNVFSSFKQTQTFLTASHPSFPSHQLRITEPSLCDPAVRQYSGYLDISDSKHLFYWFFEARHDPDHAPLMLWLNGGPGASTMASGLLFELGPCTVARNGTHTRRNPHAWTEKLNILFVDQPVGTGFSYASAGPLVTTLDALAADVYALLQLFLRHVPHLAARPLHLAAESWGGHYAPHIASHVLAQNRALAAAPPAQRGERVRVELASVVLANGLTEPASQFETIPQYLCMDAPYPLLDWNEPRCVAMRAGLPACIQAIKTCYRFPHSRATCYAATAACWPSYMSAPITSMNRNPYDIRQICDVLKNSLCYSEFDDITQWLNRTETKRALGVDPAFNFQLVNYTVNEAFYNDGQAMQNSAALLPELIAAGVRVMAFAGNTDAVCNHIGVELWMSRLEHVFHEEFARALERPWLLDNGLHVGMVRTAGPGAGNVTFVEIFDAGHMAPHDQPEATLVRSLRIFQMLGTHEMGGYDFPLGG